MSTTTRALADVAAERARQIDVEGWTTEQDDGLEFEELPIAAVCYIIADAYDSVPEPWPFAVHWWKPKDRRRNLVRAGALILAEIERLDRIADAADEGGA
jgi:hypothetical protein